MKKYLVLLALMSFIVTAPAFAGDPGAQQATVMRRIIPANVVSLSPVTVGPYRYDAAGNIIHMGADRYTYDEMSRIITGTAVTTLNSDTQQFDYDGFGNVKTIIIPNKSVLYIDHNSSTNRLSDVSGSETGANVLHMWGGAYDTAGNQLSANGTASYLFDNVNMMSEMTAPRREMYIYDANDERVATVAYTDTQNAVWRYTLRDEVNHVLRTVTDTVLNGAHSWQQTEDYVYRRGEMLAAITPQGSGETRKHFHLDHLGSAILITDDNGLRLASHKYWPFGVEAPGSDVDGEPLKFTGHERALSGFSGLGLDYMHARFYSADTARFLSLEPARDWDAKQTQSWNLYSYARNNPTDKSDPTGKWVTPIHERLLALAFPGLTTGQLAILMNASRRADSMLTGQFSSGAYKHAMRGRGETVAQAMQKSANFYNEKISEARTDLADAKAHSGDGTGRSEAMMMGSLQSIGEAMHMVADASSPAHKGWQYWSMITDPIGSIEHPFGEKTIDPVTQNLIVQQLRSIYASVYGDEALKTATEKKH